MEVITKIVIDIASGAVIERQSEEYSGPVAHAIGFSGGGGSSSSSSSKTKFPRKFFDETIDYFGKPPEFNPSYVGFDDFDKLEENLYGSQQSKLLTAYNDAVRRRREELSQSGLLNSPNQYLEGGARETLDRDYLTQLQQAARDATLGRLGAQQEEAGRETEFNVNKAQGVLQRWLALLGVAAQAGRQSKGSASTSPSFGFQIGPFTTGG